MPGAVTLLTRERALGWAAHPRLPLYRVTLNLVLRSRVVLTIMAEGAPPGGPRSVPGPGWFDIDLAALSLPELALDRLAFIIGETDERLPTPLPVAREPVLRVEDILSLNLSRSWVTGATYHDAIRAGRSDADVVDLLYRDILGRPADPGGLLNYLDRLRAGLSSLDDVRGSLMASDECRNRPRDVSEASGAIFSLRLVAQAGAGPGDHVVNLLPETTPSRSRTTAALLDAAAPAAATGPDPVPRVAGEVVTLPARMPEFATGWHGLEGAGDTERRWMERHATLLNPWPHLPVTGIVLRLHETYLHQLPELTCLLDEVETVWRHEGAAGAPSRVWIGPSGGMAACRFVTLRLDCANAGSPLEQGISADPRLLSIAVSEVSFTYGEPGSESVPAPPPEAAAQEPVPEPSAVSAAMDAPPEPEPAQPEPPDAGSPEPASPEDAPEEAATGEAPEVDRPADPPAGEAAASAESPPEEAPPEEAPPGQAPPADAPPEGAPPGDPPHAETPGDDATPPDVPHDEAPPEPTHHADAPSGHDAQHQPHAAEQPAG